MSSDLPPPVVPNGTTRHGLVIGIDKYVDERLNLRCAVADARVLHELMIDAECGCFPHDNVQLLLDGEATTEGIFRALARLRRRVAENDVVWIYYAGHAAVDDHAYWVTHNTDVDDLFATALDSGRINAVLSQLRTSNVLLILDCCHAAATALVKNQTRAVVTANELFGRFQGHGRITLAASDGKQKSVELSEFGHGAFTYFLEKGLRGEADMDNDGVVTADELWSYLRRKVAEASGRVGNLQTPMLSGSMTHDVALTLNAAVAANRQRLMSQIEKMLGLRPHQLTTDEGRYCEEILVRGARTEPERVLLESLEELAGGQLTQSQFRRFVQANMQLAGRQAPLPAREAAAAEAAEADARKKSEADPRAQAETQAKSQDDGTAKAGRKAAEKPPEANDGKADAGEDSSGDRHASPPSERTSESSPAPDPAAAAAVDAGSPSSSSHAHLDAAAEPPANVRSERRIATLRRAIFSSIGVLAGLVGVISFSRHCNESNAVDTTVNDASVVIAMIDDAVVRDDRSIADFVPPNVSNDAVAIAAAGSDAGSIPVTPNTSAQHGWPAVDNWPAVDKRGCAIMPGHYPVKIDSAPQGAAIYINDKACPAVGVTPWEGKLNNGDYTVIVEAPGHDPATRLLKVTRVRKTQEMFIPLVEKLEPPKIDVRADADKNVVGATVTLDGQPQGQAPTILTTTAGRHQVALKKTGFEEYSAWLEVKDNQVQTFAPTIKEIAKPKYGTVVVDANVADAEVFIDGNRHPDNTPAMITNVIEGLHTIEVRKPPAPPWKQTIEVKANQQTKVGADLAPVHRGSNTRIKPP